MTAQPSSFASGTSHFLHQTSRNQLPGQAMDQRRKSVIVAVVLSLLLYGILIAAPLLDADAYAKLEEAFGRRPLGLPVDLVVVAGLTLWYIPVPWMFWHTLQLASQAIQDRRGFGIIYVLTVSQRHPELRKSQMVCLGGLIYFVIACAIWILYAEMKGI